MQGPKFNSMKKLAALPPTLPHTTQLCAIINKGKLCALYYCKFFLCENEIK